MNLHFVGDSHVSVFAGHGDLIPHPYGLPHAWIAPLWPNRVQSIFNPSWWCYHVGPHLAVNFLKYGFPVAKEIVSRYFSDNNLLCLVWGEIDCRLWIVARGKKLGKGIETEARECARSYLDGIDKINYLEKDSIVIIGPHPSPPWAIGEPYGTVGTEPERNLGTKILNEEIKKGADERDIRFISLFDRLMPIDLNKDFYRDVIHLSVDTLPMFVESFKSVGIEV